MSTNLDGCESIPWLHTHAEYCIHAFTLAELWDQYGIVDNLMVCHIIKFIVFLWLWICYHSHSWMISLMLISTRCWCLTSLIKLSRECSRNMDWWISQGEAEANRILDDIDRRLAKKCWYIYSNWRESCCNRIAAVPLLSKFTPLFWRTTIQKLWWKFTFRQSKAASPQQWCAQSVPFSTSATMHSMNVHWRTCKTHLIVFTTSAASSRNQVFVTVAPKASHYLVWNVTLFRNSVRQMVYAHPLLNRNTSRLSRDPGGAQTTSMLWAKCWSQTSALINLLLREWTSKPVACLRALSFQHLAPIIWDHHDHSRDHVGSTAGDANHDDDDDGNDADGGDEIRMHCDGPQVRLAKTRGTATFLCLTARNYPSKLRALARHILPPNTRT